MNFALTLGEYIRYKRTVANMSITDLQKVGIPFGSFAYIERGQRPLPDEWVDKILEAIPGTSLAAIKILRSLDNGKLEVPVTRDSPPALLVLLEFLCTETIDWSRLDPEYVRQLLLSLSAVRGGQDD